MDGITVSIGLAFLAGLASFFSPCVFSLVPAYIGYLSGDSLARQERPRSETRLRTFLNGLAFVLGFSFVFISLGLAFTALSQVLYQIRDLMAKFGGLVVILFGLQMFNYDIRLRPKPGWGRSILTSFLMGIFFSAGWSPCVGPTLGLILTLAFEQANIGQGILLLSGYSLGMAIPFLVAAVAVGWVSNILHKHARTMRIIEIIMGVIMIIVGVLLFLGLYQKMVTFSPIFDFGL